MEIKMKDILTFVEQKVRRIAQLEHLNYELDGDLTNSQIENDKLKKQIEELTDKLNESNRDLKVLTKQLDEQFSFFKMHKSIIEKKQELIDFQNQRISDYIISVNDLDSTNNLLKQEIESLESENKELVSLSEINYNKVVQYQTDNSNLLKENDKLGLKIWNLEKEIESLKSEPIKTNEFNKIDQIELKETLKEQLESDFSIHDSTHYNQIIFFHENEIDVKDKDFFSKSIELLTENIMKIVRIYY